MNRSSARKVVFLARVLSVGGLAAAVFAAGTALAAAPPSKAGTPKAGAALKGDPSAGAKTFAMRCAACHGAEGAGGPMAPALTNVYGAHAGRAAFAKYSPALKAAELSWTAANLDAFLAAPAKRVPGTAMMGTVASAAERANLVAYLATLHSGPHSVRR